MPENTTSNAPGGYLDAVTQAAPSLFSQLLPQLLGVGSQAAATALQAGRYDDAIKYLRGIADFSKEQQVAGYNQGLDATAAQRTGLGDILSGQNPWLQMLNQGLIGNIGTLNNMLPGLLGGNLIDEIPYASDLVRGITDLTGNTGGILNAAANLINSGGVTPQMQPALDFSQRRMAGSTPEQQALLQSALGLTQAGGTTPELANAIGRLFGVGDMGTSLLATGGTTPEIQSALAQVQNLIATGGASPLTTQLGGRAAELADREPLLPTDLAAAFAKDQASRNYANQAQVFRRQQAARSGEPGAIVASGAGANELADFSDIALPGISKAVQDTLLSQQGLGLQEMLAGLTGGLDAAKIESNTQLGALQALANLVNTATNRAELGGQLALGAPAGVAGLTNAATNRAGVGGNQLTDVGQLGNTGANQLLQLLGLQQGNVGMGLQSGLQGVNSQANLLQTALQDLMQGRTSSANIGNTLANLYGSNINALGSAINTGLGSNMTALGQYGQQIAPWLNYGSDALRTMGTTGTGVAEMNKFSPWSNFLNNLGGAAPQAQQGGSGALGTVGKIASGVLDVIPGGGLVKGIGSILGKIF